jgi:hypothetical protein
VLAIVLTLNFLIGCSCLFAAWRLWRLKYRLARIADMLIYLEQKVHRLLYPAPDAIHRGQAGTRVLRQRLQRLEPQIQRVQQVMGLLRIGRTLWFRSIGVTRRSRRNLKQV